MKPAINTWDLFDTLVARFLVEPHHVLRLVEQRSGVSGFAQARQQAQRILDGRGQPYTLHQIYRCMEQHLGVSPELGCSLIAMELAVEMDQLIPVRRQIDRVAPDDLVVSDMYLSADQVQDIMRRVCGLHACRPPVVGNWGKARGSVWTHLAAEYLIRRHHGDHPVSDREIPGRFEIPTEMIGDAGLTGWERQLDGAGQSHLACVVREVRLRTLPLQAGSFHETVVGPYMTLVLCAALYLRQLALDGPRRKLIFVSRDCCHVSHVFRTICPAVESEQLDLTRGLLQSGAADAPFASRLEPGCLIVDMVSSGNSLSRFFERTGMDRECLFFVYFDRLLTDAQRHDRARRTRDGRLAVLFPVTELADPHHNLEILLDPGHATVAGVRCDASSGALVKTFGPADATHEERELTGFANRCVSELAASVARRGFPGAIASAELVKLLRMSVDAIGRDGAWLSMFPTFTARETRGWA